MYAYIEPLEDFWREPYQAFFMTSLIGGLVAPRPHAGRFPLRHLTAGWCMFSGVGLGAAADLDILASSGLDNGSDDDKKVEVTFNCDNACSLRAASAHGWGVKFCQLKR